MDDKGAQKYCHHHTGGDAEGDRGDQAPPQRGIVGSAGAKDAFHGPLAEAFPVRGALYRMGIGQPLRRSRAQSGNDGTKSPDSAAPDHEPPVPKGILDPLHDAA